MRQATKLIAIALLAALPSAIQAAIVRGRLVRGKAAAAGIAVTVLNPQKIRTAASNVKAGSYTLEIWVNRNKPLNFPIQVREPQTDVNPVNVP
jgi:hypothetical protein